MINIAPDIAGATDADLVKLIGGDSACCDWRPSGNFCVARRLRPETLDRLQQIVVRPGDLPPARRSVVYRSSIVASRGRDRLAALGQTTMNCANLQFARSANVAAGLVRRRPMRLPVF